MGSPGAGWSGGYRAEARRSALPVNLSDLTAALAWVGTCLDPVLDGTVTAGTWNPQARAWTSP
jgi:hypothetical protein